ncbi:Autophagy protein 22 [Naganishia albida]|nr:Autophagy protein 22 [Naganishia albida]
MIARNRPLAAFYTYSAACGVFSCISTGLFMPIFLEQLARSHGSLGPDGAKCGKDEACSVYLMGMWLDTTAYSLYTKSINVALQAITLISISVLADIPEWRNRLITSLATLGSLLASTFLVLPTAPHVSLYFASAIVVVSSVCMSDSYVCLNAMLPELAEGRPGELREDAQEEEEEALLDGLGRGSLEIVDLPAPPTPTPSKSTQKTSALGQISSRGIAIGFGAGVSALTLSLIPISFSGGSLRAMQSVIGASGVIWALLTGSMWILLPSVPKAEGQRGVVSRKVKEGWRRVGALVDGEEVRRLRVTYWYLLASALLQDAFNTTLAVSILFAKTSLGMPPSRVILVGLLMQLTAVASASMTPVIQRRYRLDGIQSILVCVVMGLMMCAWGMIGLVNPWFGLRSSGEMYICAIWFGLLYGPFDSLARSVLVDFIPPGQEARFFSLFSITDKSASFLGPAAIACVADWTGEIRYGFAVLALLMIAPVPILRYYVDQERGRRDAKEYASWADGN